MTNVGPSSDPLSELKSAIASANEDQIFQAALHVGDAGLTVSTPLLLELLEADPRIRVKNGAALALRELRANEAVPILIELIEGKSFQKQRGTFVYALQTLDWFSKYSHAIARLLTDSNFEVRTMAFQALSEAEHAMSDDQKSTMLAALLLRLTALLQDPGLDLDGLVETVRSAVPLLVTKKSLKTAELAMA